MHDCQEKGTPPTLIAAVSVALLALNSVAAAQAQQAEAAAQTDARRFDVAEYVVKGNTVLDARSIEKAVTPFLGPQRTLQDLEAARDALLAAYQAKGYQSVYVDVPQQPMTGGVVYLLVSETKVGRVRVVGAKYSSPLAVRDQVPALKQGEVPDFNQAQAELTALNRSGARQVMPLVKQGSLPGTMDVDLKVEDSKPWRTSMGLNNDSSPDTEDLRALASLGYDNLWQRAHSASVSFFVAPQDPDETNVWSASYIAPIGANWSLETSGYISDSDVATVGGTTVLGKGHSVGLKATYTAPMTGAWWHSWSAGVDFKDNDEALTFDNAGDFVPLRYAPITVAYSGFTQTERLQLALGSSAVIGTRSFFGYNSNSAQFDYKRYKASPSFLVLKSDVNATYTFGNELQLGLRLAGQITDSPLVSSEQIAAGGMNSVRGYLSAEATGDYGVVGSLEFRTMPLNWFTPWVDSWRAYVFTDAGHLRITDGLPEQDSEFTLFSAGLGTTFRIAQYITARLDVGYPIETSLRTERDEPKVNFSLNASY
ncbi:ShlB/FhaC/HecB family hemolysin secretion/activation protein [Steroidobacter sp. S1-65]|uniref:ShlB/FhaC/HecB family hemolysin secretion/activation protein n=1 Tax=Steroidobacter gossypii TaxID=2805490 RepID=A0ABS1WZF2_9GAMM|nr:ShlB/FhaC/HecB family hemolysin secretion/activation protein [Steroidobacter gossypii]MBM0106358.1 ShlB/FhaC/HecB family hemolysin secretion/activation protein [Steroidobacter gossypii]